MLNTLRRLFTDLISREAVTVFAEDDPRLSVAALMCHVIAADGVVRTNERERMVSALAQRYRMSEDDARDLAEAARRVELESATVQRFTAGLERGLPLSERREIVAALWRIVFADGVVQEFEEAIVGRIADLLGIEPHERTALRKAVEAEVEEEAMRSAEAAIEPARAPT